MMELGLYLIWPDPFRASEHRDRNHLQSVVISNAAELLTKNPLTVNEDLVNRQDNLNIIHHILKEMPTLELPKTK